MKRALIYRWLVLSFLSLYLPVSAATTDRPNIVFILTDDMGYSDPGCYGGTIAPTPQIDRLASEGIRFTHFYDDAPICSASRCSYITGMYPARWNFTTYLDNRIHNQNCEQADFLTTNAPALARVLKAAGYETAHFGKWHLGGGRDVTNAPLFKDYGYDESIGTYESPEPDPNITATDWIWSPKDKIKRWDRTGYFVNHALDFLKRHQGQPCYVEIWPDDVHDPWVPSVETEHNRASWETRTNLSAVLKEYDRQIGRLLDGLKMLGLDTNTLVVFTSDNGPLPAFNHARTGGLRGSKLSLYEGGVRVPFIVRWPGHATAGRVDEQTVMEMVDLFPTFCAIAGAQLPSGFDFNGKNVATAFDSKAASNDRTIFWEYGRKSKSFYYPHVVYDRSPHLAVREGKWKLLVNQDGTDVQLYDIDSDRNETTNVAEQNPKIAKNMTEAALAWKRSLPVLVQNLGELKFAGARASHTWQNDTVDAVRMKHVPTHSNDRQMTHWSSWPQKGKDQWVEIDLGQKKNIKRIGVYWFDNNDGVETPVKWHIETADGNGWVSLPVNSAAVYGIKVDDYNTVEPTEPVTTDKLRIMMSAQNGSCVGILSVNVDVE